MTLAFEDLAGSAPVETGPLVVTPEALDLFVALTGEEHPLHVTDAVVPAGLLHSMVAGALVREQGPVAVAGLRRMTWRFVRALRAGETFRVRSEVVSSALVTAEVGTVSVRRTVLDAAGDTLAVGAVDLAVRACEALTCDDACSTGNIATQLDSAAAIHSPADGVSPAAAVR